MKFYNLLFLFQYFIFIYATPVIFWVPTAVTYPNETVLIQGANLDTPVSVSLCNEQGQNCIHPNLIDQWEYSIKFIIPDTMKLAVYTIQVCNNTDCSKLWSLNAATVTWIQGDRGNISTQGGELRVFGGTLAFSNNEKCISALTPLKTSNSQIFLIDTQGKQINLPNVEATCYDLRVSLPTTISYGNYTVGIQNSLQTKLTTLNRDGETLKITIGSTYPYPTKLFDIRKDYAGDLIATINAANTAGGGIVYLSSGPDISVSDGMLLTLHHITLQGDGMTKSRIIWNNNSKLPSDYLITGEYFRIIDINLVVVGPNNGFIQSYPGTSDIIIQRVNITMISNDIMRNAIWINTADRTDIFDNYIYYDTKNCGESWPRLLTIWLHASRFNRFINNTIYTRCGGYATSGIQDLVMINNYIYQLAGGRDEGNGFNTLESTYVSERIAFYRNCQIGDLTSTERYESSTGDGGGGLYFGTASSWNSTSITLKGTANLVKSINQVVMIVNGTGAGQFNRISNFSNLTQTIQLRYPLLSPIDNNSFFTIVAYRGDNLLIGNTFINGTVVQNYGVGIYYIFTENYFNIMTASPNINPAGISVFGKNYQGGEQPTYYSEVVDNYFWNATGITLRTDNQLYPKLRAAIVKRNYLQTNSWIKNSNQISDVVIENNVFVNVSTPYVTIDSRSDHVYQRNNGNGTGQVSPPPLCVPPTVR